MNSRRYHEVDFMYTLGVILVLIGHSHSSDWTKIYGTPIEYIISFIYAFHMPLFFSISGFLFMNSHKIEKIGYCKYIADKGIKLFVPYFFLSLIVLFPKMHSDTGSFFDINYILRALFSPRNGVWGHLWFVPILFFCYVVFGALNRIWKSRFKVSALIALVICVCLYFIPCNISLFGIADLKDALLFFVFGMIINSLFKLLSGIKLSIKLVIVIIGLISSIIGWKYFFDYQIAKMLIAVVMIFDCWVLSSIVRENALCTWISRHNFTIYLYSWPAQYVAMIGCDKFALPWLPMLLIMFFTGVFAPIVLIVLYEKLNKIHCRFLDLILGVK